MDLKSMGNCWGIPCRWKVEQFLLAVPWWSMGMGLVTSRKVGLWRHIFLSSRRSLVELWSQSGFASIEWPGNEFKIVKINSCKYIYGKNMKNYFLGFYSEKWLEIYVGRKFLPIFSFSGFFHLYFLKKSVRGETGTY